VDERRRRAWAALGIGPAWRLRDPGTPPAGEEAPIGPTASDAPDGTRGRLGGTGPLDVHGRSDGDGPLDADGGTTVPGSGPADPVAVAGSPDSPGSRRDPAIAGLEWPALQQAVAGCAACGLCRSRRRTVFGAGPSPARWMLVGEAPGEQEDARGEPFVGPAGQLLDEMLAAIGVDRPSEAFVANVLKCRPPGNRNPQPEEVARCEPYLLRQVELVRPALVVALGRFAAQSLLRTDASIASLRGRVHRLRAGAVEVPLVVTYHPAYLLRTPADKARSWQDLRLARRACDGQG
jgi:uracil-DNA glycosylase family 4